jgi:hypothetical protein
MRGMNRFLDDADGPDVAPSHALARMARTLAYQFGEDAVVDSYWYTSGLRRLGALATDTFAIAIQAEADFILDWVSGIIADEVAGPLISPGAVDGSFNAFATVEIRDTGSGRALMNAPVYWHNLVGTGQRPTYLPAPRYFRSNSAIQVTVRELISNASQYELVLGGLRAYR